MSPIEPRLPAHAIETIGQFLRAHAGRSGIVVGLSGGIDSAVTARLARDALGAEHVFGVLLPDAGFSPALLRETEEYADGLGVEHRTVGIDPVEQAFRTLLPEVTDRVALGNVKARIRMTVLHSLARERQALVAGTGNKSELLLGYFTKYGDGGVDLMPLGDLYKTEVRALAVELGLPRPIQDRPPTAGLWEGQTDEAELGLGYEEIDRILFGVEQLLTEDRIAEETGSSLDHVREVTERVRKSRHKRRPPPIPKLSLRTVGIDWRE